MRPLHHLRNPRVLAGALFVSALLAVGFWPAAEPVDVSAVVRGPLRVTVDEEGETRVRQRFVVSAPVSGQVLRIALEPGDPVRRGDTVLATLMPATPQPLDARVRAEAGAAVAAAEASLGAARAERDRAAAALAHATAERDRYRMLERETLATRQALDAKELEARTAADALRAAEFVVAAAAHQLDMAKGRLVHVAPGQAAGRAITVLAPIDGIVLKRHRESEAVVAAGEPLVEIGDPRSLEIVSDLLSGDAVKVRPGAPVLVEQWGGDSVVRARVRRVDPSGFMKVSALGVEQQRVNVVMDFDDPAEARAALGDGYRVEVRIVLWESPSVLKVATSSLFRHGDGWAAFVMSGGRAALRSVEVGRRNGAEAEVRGGLREGDLVVLHPSDSLRAGARVARRTR